MNEKDCRVRSLMIKLIDNHQQSIKYSQNAENTEMTIWKQKSNVTMNIVAIEKFSIDVFQNLSVMLMSKEHSYLVEDKRTRMINEFPQFDFIFCYRADEVRPRNIRKDLIGFIWEKKSVHSSTFIFSRKRKSLSFLIGCYECSTAASAWNLFFCYNKQHCSSKLSSFSTVTPTTSFEIKRESGRVSSVIDFVCVESDLMRYSLMKMLICLQMMRRVYLNE